MRYGGPFVHKTERVNTTLVLLNLIKANPKASREEVEKLYEEEIREDEEMISACIKYAFRNEWNGIHHPRYRHKNGKDKADEKITSESRIADYVAKIRKGCILDWISSTGRPYRECTFAIAVKDGGAIAKLGKLGKPNQIIGDFVSDKQARALMK